MCDRQTSGRPVQTETREWESEGKKFIFYARLLLLLPLSFLLSLNNTMTFFSIKWWVYMCNSSKYHLLLQKRSLFICNGISFLRLFVSNLLGFFSSLIRTNKQSMGNWLSMVHFVSFGFSFNVIDNVHQQVETSDGHLFASPSLSLSLSYTILSLFSLLQNVNWAVTNISTNVSQIRSQSIITQHATCIIESMVTYMIRCLTHISLEEEEKTVWVFREMTVMETLSSFASPYSLAYTCCFNQRHASIQPWPKIIFTACTMIYDNCPLVILKQSLDTNRLLHFSSTSQHTVYYHITCTSLSTYVGKNACCDIEFVNHHRSKD